MKKHTNKNLRRGLALFMTVLMALSCFSAGLTVLAAIDGVPTRTNAVNQDWYSDSTLYDAEKWDKSTDAASLTFNWNAYNWSLGYDPQPGSLTFTYPSHIYLNVGETLEAAGYMGHMTASYGENDGSDVTDFRVMLSSATWGESTRDGFSPVSSLISNYGHQGTCTEGSKLMTGSSSHYDFSNDAHGSDQIIRNKTNENENFEYDHEKLIVWRSNIQWTGSNMNNFDEYVLLTGTANKTGEVTFNPTSAQNFTIGAAQRYTASAWHTDNGSRLNRYLFNNGSRPECTPAEDALSMTFTVYDKSELNRLIEAADNGVLTPDANALAAARVVLADREVTQAQIDAAANAIGDRMTMLVNQNESGYSAAAATTGLATGTGSANAFEAAAFHQGAQTFGGYSNVVYSPIWSTSWSGVGGADQAVAIGRCDMKIAIPRNVVMVYDGVHEAYAPITLETKCNDTNGSSHIIHYVDYNSNSLYEVKNDFWQGYARQWDVWAKDNISATEQFAAYWHDGGSPGESPDSQRDGDSRFWWNMIKYYGEGNTTSYYDHESNFKFDAKTSYKSGSRQYKYGTVTSKTDFYTINYQPIYSKLAEAAAVKDIIEGANAWMYTEASVRRAKATIAAMIASNPKNFFNNNQKFSEDYDADSAAVASAVSDCAVAIIDAKYMIDNGGLVLEKKQGTVTFVDQNGITIAANGTTYSYTKEYGETVSGVEIPVLGATYNRTDNAQWDYSAYPDLSWSPAIENNSILINEPEMIYQINDNQTVQTYTVTFYDEDGTVLATADWQYGDYPDWGGTYVKQNGETTEVPVPTKDPGASQHYSFFRWEDTEGVQYELNGILRKFEVADVANSTRADLDTNPYLNYTAVYAGTDHTFGETSYSWTGYTACTATRTCTAEGCGYSETATATITSSVDSAPTCSATGTKTYTATFAEEWAATQTTPETLGIDENAHTYTFDSFVWDTSVTPPTAQAKYVCSANNTHDPAYYNATVEQKSHTDATCTDQEETVYTASYDGHEEDKTVTGSVDEDAHAYGEPTYEWAADYSTVTATRVCAHNTNHIETETVSATRFSYSAPTCTDGGLAVYNPDEFENPAFEESSPHMYIVMLGSDPDAHNYLDIYNEVIRPVKDDTTGEWGKGTLVYYCINTIVLDDETGEIIGRDETHDKTEEVDRADYTEYDAVVEDFAALNELDLNLDYVIEDEDDEGNPITYTLGDLLDETAELLASIPQDYVEPEQEYLDELIPDLIAMFNEISNLIDELGDDAYNHYEIKYVNTDGTELASYSKKLNETVAYDGATPVCPDNDAQYTYAFTGWSDGETTYAADAIPSVAGDATYTAVYDTEHPTTNSYEISFVNYAGETVDTQTVDYNDTPTAPSENTAAYSDDYYKYTYSWPDLAAVTGEASYTEVQSRTWNDEKQGIINDAGDIVADALDTTSGDDYDPDYIEDIQEQLAIINDPDATDSAKEAAVDMLATLVAGADDNKLYTITWVDAGDPATTTVAYGVVPTHDLPTRDDDEYYTYSFAWDTEPVAVTGEATYTAIQTRTWNEAKQTIINTAGAIITDANDPETGYDYDSTYIGQIQSLLAVINDPDATDTAKEAAVDALESLIGSADQYKFYTITFVTDGSAVDAITDLYGTAVTLPDTEKDGCHFEGWYADSAFAADSKATNPYTLTGDVTLYAFFEELSLDGAAVEEAIATATAGVTMGTCYTAATYEAYQSAIAAVRAFKDQPATAANLEAYNNALSDLDTAVAALVVEHAYTGDPTLTRPVKDADTGEWGTGTYTWTCANDADHPVKTESVDRADYTKYDDVLAQINTLLENDYTDDVITALTTAKTAMEAIQQDYVVPEQDQLDAAIQAILNTLNENDKITVNSDGGITVSDDAYKTYTLTVGNNVNSSTLTYTKKAGEQVVLTLTLTGYTFKSWSENANLNAETGVYTFPAADDTITALYVKDLTGNETIAAAQSIIADANDTTTGSDYDETYVGNLEDLLEELDEIKDDPMKLDEVEQLLEDIQELVDAANSNKLYTITWVIDGAIEATKVKVGETPTHAEPTKEGYNFTGWTPSIVAVTGDATYTAQFTEITSSGAEYEEYDDLFAILDVLKDNDAILPELLEQINDKVDNPLPRDLTADQQNIIDEEVDEIKAILDQIVEKDGNGDYTTSVKESALVHCSVTFYWLTTKLTKTVVKGEAVAAPNVTQMYGVEGMESGHYVFDKWTIKGSDSTDFDLESVAGDLELEGHYKLEEHTGSWVEHEKTCSSVAWHEIDCTTCGMHFKANTGTEKGPHDWNDWVVVEATCARPGSRTRTCKNDPSHKETEVIQQLAHTDANGDTICDVCGNPTEAHQHTDNNDDKKCDTCGANVNIHVHNDYNNDGVCDGCGKNMDGTFRCNLCSFYEQYRNVPVFGWFVTLLHFFYHLVAQITSWR